jgi:hypothetical protein
LQAEPNRIRCFAVATKNKVWRSVDPLSSWKKGFVGWLHRHHSIALQIITETGLAAFLWKKVGWQAGIIAAACCVPATVFVVLERRYWIRELQIGSDFHKIAHFMRDEIGDLRRLANEPDQGRYLYAYGQVHAKLCDRIARYFQSATNDSTVNCAIRLAVADGANVVYKTVGRSIGMDEQREQRSVPIPVDQGLARTLRDHNHLGVCHIRDIAEAIAANWWMPCPSDAFEDVRVVMAAPINWCADEAGAQTKVMGGILYVTSRRDNLRQRHVEPLKAFADLLGSVYPAITGKPQYQE